MKNHPETLPASPASVWTNPIHFLAFGFGSGLAPKAPGTWGSLLALLLFPLPALLSLPTAPPAGRPVADRRPGAAPNRARA